VTQVVLYSIVNKVYASIDIGQPVGRDVAPDSARAGVGIPSVAISSRSSVPQRSVVSCTSISIFQLGTLHIIDFGG
jgi:hypothetical protein